MRWLVLLLFPFLSYTQNYSAIDIIKKSEEKLRKATSSMKADLKITTIRPKWTKSKTIRTWTDGNNGMIMIIAPEKEEGISFLKTEEGVWNYIPKINSTVKMPPSLMMNSFMGSELSNDDMIHQSSNVEDFNHQLLNDTIINGRECYQIELTPKPQSMVVWGKVVMSIDKEHFIQLQTLFYDENNELINTIKGENIVVFDGVYLAKQLTVVRADKPGRKTVLEYLAVEFGLNLPADFFTKDHMKSLN
jgi:outer membrane lipoprotein-sorting protein